MKADDKQRVMEESPKENAYSLFLTTVIEVGVDIPNATVMLIEAPERFGLAQLHQLVDELAVAHIKVTVI